MSTTLIAQVALAVPALGPTPLGLVIVCPAVGDDPKEQVETCAKLTAIAMLQGVGVG